jgi:hypothetical protein
MINFRLIESSEKIEDNLGKINHLKVVEFESMPITPKP